MASSTTVADQPTPPSYEADITWGTHGVPHIVAADFGGLGFGQGWACARDHAGAIADHVNKVRSQRAAFLGRGDHDRHVHSDLGYLALEVTRRAEAMAADQPPEVVAVVEGYAAGVNAWLAEHGPSGLPRWCRDAPWVGPISALDLWRVYVDLAIMASGRNLVEYIGSAVPPGSSVDEPPPAMPGGPVTGEPGLASNAWAFGGDVTVGGRGMVMANPHFPWWGEGRFWECHLRIPGTLDVYGVSLVGAPLVQMGFNAWVAWAHTFSRGSRFTVYKLDLPAGRPTAYRYGDDEHEMTSVRRTIEVADGEGGTDTLEREMWSTHHGPMLNLPMLGWADGLGFTYRDANVDNRRFFRQGLAMCTATGMDDLQDAVATHQGLPWVNTLAADHTGRSWYIDASTTPNLSAEAARRFTEAVRTDPITQLAYGLRVVLLDGSDPAFEWQDHPDAPAPGVLPYRELPQIERRDGLFNSNDPYWFPHPEVQIAPHSPLCGLHHDHVGARSRMNARLVGGTGPIGPTGPDGRWTAEDVRAAVLGNHSVMADLLLASVVERLAGAGTVEVDGRSVDVGALAAVLDGWDGCFDLDSVGAVLWRELLASFDDRARTDAGPLFAVPYDPTDPVATPRDLAAAPDSGPDPVVDAAARAVLALEAAGLEPDVALGDCQWVDRGGRRWSVHGGFEVEGVANVIAPVGTLARADLQPGPEMPAGVPGRVERTGLHEGGYPVVYGVSFLMVVGFGDGGPEAQGLLVYGQSSDPDSEHHADQLAFYQAKELRPLRFTDAAIAADPVQEHRIVRSG
jgi:acyl-homoserine-lactone acylase